MEKPGMPDGATLTYGVADDLPDGPQMKLRPLKVGYQVTPVALPNGPGGTMDS